VKKGCALEFRAGVAYGPSPDWAIAGELSSEHEYDGLLIGGSAHGQSSAYYIGPTIQFAVEPLAVTLGAQAQLPWASGLVPGVVDHGSVNDAERFRFLLRFSTDI
jgi:hypothetical protein